MWKTHASVGAGARTIAMLRCGEIQPQPRIRLSLIHSFPSSTTFISSSRTRRHRVYIEAELPRDIEILDGTRIVHDYLLENPALDRPLPRDGDHLPNQPRRKPREHRDSPD